MLVQWFFGLVDARRLGANNEHLSYPDFLAQIKK